MTLTRAFRASLLLLVPAEFEADPVVARSAFGTKDHRLAFEIFDDNFLDPVVKQVAYGQAASHAGNLEGRPYLIADIAERAVTLVEEELARLAEVDADVGLIHLRVYVAVDGDEVEPSVIVDIVKGVSPTHHVSGGAGDARDVRDIGKAQIAVVAEELRGIAR